MASTATKAARPTRGKTPDGRHGNTRPDPADASEDAVMENMLAQIDQILDATAQITDRLQRSVA